MKPSAFAVLSLLLIVPAVAQDAALPAEINTSDYPDLQSAVDALPAAGGIVRLAPGQHEITDPLVIRTPETRLEGAGPATHIVNLNENGMPALRLGADDYAENSNSRLWRIQLGNFRISGNPKSGAGVLAEGINEIFIHGLSVDRHGSHGIHLVNCYEDPRVADSILTYNGDAGLHIDGGHDIVVSATQFEENRDGLRCLDGFNLTCTGNNFDDHLQHGIVIENTYGSVVSGNMIEECQGIGIVLDRDCYGITLSANVIAHEFEGGIDLRDAWGCAISANTFTIVHKFGIRVAPSSGRLAITGNTFANSYLGDAQHKRVLEHEQKAQIDTGNGVILEDAEDVVVSGNLFSGIDGSAIACQGQCERISITGNIITDFARRQNSAPAIAPPMDDASILKDNIVR